MTDTGYTPAPLPPIPPTVTRELLHQVAEVFADHLGEYPDGEADYTIVGWLRRAARTLPLEDDVHVASAPHPFGDEGEEWPAVHVRWPRVVETMPRRPRLAGTAVFPLDVADHVARRILIDLSASNPVKFHTLAALVDNLRAAPGDPVPAPTRPTLVQAIRNHAQGGQWKGEAITVTAAQVADADEAAVVDVDSGHSFAEFIRAVGYDVEPRGRLLGHIIVRRPAAPTP